MITVTKVEEGFRIESDLLEDVVAGDTIEVSILNTCCGASDVLELVEVEEPLFPPTVFQNDEVISVPCLVEDTNDLILYFNAIPQLDRTIDWDTLTITRIVNSSDVEVTLGTVGIAASAPVEGTINNGIYNGYITFTGDPQSEPGTYTFYWTVDDSEGVTSEEGYIIVEFGECEGGALSFVYDPTPTQEQVESALNDYFILGSEYLAIEGVYTIKVKVTHTDGSSTTETLCYFNEVNLACRVGRAAIEDCTSDVHFDYFVLISMQNCACDCNNMCLLFQRIIKKLDEEFCCEEATGTPCHQC